MKFFSTLLMATMAAVSSLTVVNLEDMGLKADASDITTCNANSALLTHHLNYTRDTHFIIPNKTYHVNGGINGVGLRNVILQLDGTLKYQDDMNEWPRGGNGGAFECMHFEDIENVTFTSSGKGTFDGSGAKWWGYINYLKIAENRPRLFVIHNAQYILVENLLFLNSPYWTFWANDVADLEIRYSEVSARRNSADYHDLYNIAAFNTDGFDVAGKNIWIHHCKVWNDDDTFCVKESSRGGLRADCSENILIENVESSGVGLTIGSIGSGAGHNCVRNVTFRNAYQHHPFKGIYVKSRPDDSGTGEISNILYENITMDEPSQWPIWIGPQQAFYDNACSLLWPFVPGTKCPVPPLVTISNITLRNIFINHPKISPGVILGNEQNPIQNVVFENVVVKHNSLESLVPFGTWYYKCMNVNNGVAIGSTNPVPSCFKKVDHEPANIVIQSME